jgi:hypothetical protein
VHYIEAIKALFNHPKAGMQLLLMSVCMLIPAIGPIVLLGFHTEVFVLQHKTGEKSYPEFDFNRFTDYLGRGIWPVLVGLVVGLIAVPPSLVVFAPLLLIPHLELRGPQVAGPIAASAILYLLLLLVLTFFSVAMTIHSALSQSFSRAFSLAFIKEFVRRVWIEILLMHLFLTVVSIPAMLVGYLLCFVGIYPVIAILIFASWQLYRQLYELYLQRGGQPVSIAPVLLVRLPGES